MAKRNRRKSNKAKNKIIRKSMVRNIAIVIILIVFLFVIYKFNFSAKSEVVETIELSFSEYGYSYVETQSLSLEVKTDDSGNKYINLPDVINGYYVEAYYFVPTEEDTTETEDDETDTTNTVDTTVETTSLESSEETTSEENTTVESSTDISSVVIQEVNGQKDNFQTSQEYDEESALEEFETDESDSDTEISQDTNTVENDDTTVEESTTNTTTSTDTTNTTTQENNTVVSETTNTTTNTVTNTTSTVTNTTTNTLTNTTDSENVIESNTVYSETYASDEEETEETTATTKTCYPGETYYLTVDDNENVSIDGYTIQVEYVTITDETYGYGLLYKQEISETDSNGAEISVVGYIPVGYGLTITDDTTAFDTVKTNIEDEYLSTANTILADDITITDDSSNEFDYEQNYEVTITYSGFESYSSDNLAVLHIEDETDEDGNIVYDENGTPEQTYIEIGITSKDSTEIVFKTDSFSTYGVVSYATFVGETVIVDDYTSDYNYYMGKNYTDDWVDYSGDEDTEETVVPTYTTDNLAKVKINYYGYNPSETQSTLTLKGSISDAKLTQTSGAYYYYSVVISVSGDEYIDTDSSWTMSFSTTEEINLTQTNASNSKYISDISQNLVDSSYIVTIKGNDWNSGWIGNDGTYYSTSDTISLVLVFTTEMDTDDLNNTSVTVTTNKLILSGYVSNSDSERYNMFTYIKCVPITDGNVTVELIDNPFMDRPAGYGFNGWITHNSSATISTNSLSFEQNITVALSAIEDDSGDYVIDVYVDWEEANIVFVDTSSDTNGTGKSISSPTNNWTNNNNNNSAVTVLNNNIKTSTNATASNRELNIIVLIGGSITNINLTSPSTAYTLTSLYNGVLYTSNSTYVTMSTNNNSSTTLSYDLQLDFLRLYTNYDYNTNNDGTGNTNACLYSNTHNLRIGRGMEFVDNYVTFSQVQGGLSTGTANSLYKIVIESGKYSNIQVGRAGGNKYTSTGILVIGSDFDRISDDNTKFYSYRRISSRTAGTEISPGTTGTIYYSGSNINTTTGLNYLMVIKSGTLGMDYFSNADNDECAYSGIYLGGHGSSGTDKGDRYLVVEGGKIANIIGGLQTGSSGTPDTRIYVKGGNVANIVGGAGLTQTYGDRTIQVTGGSIAYSISGGSNGVFASSNTQNGKLSGSTYVYVGGNAYVGTAIVNTDDRIGTTSSTTNITSSYGTVLYNVPAGSVLGAGNGNANQSNSGDVNTSHIVIDGNAKIYGSVYGGGNYGTVGYTSYSGSTSTEAENKITLTDKSSSITSGESYLILNGTETTSNSLTASDDSITNTANVGKSIPSNTQMWILVSSGDGYTIQNVSTGYYLSISANTNNNGNVTSYSLALSTEATVFSYDSSNHILSITATITNTYGGGPGGGGQTYTQTVTYYLRYNNGNWSINTYQATAVYFCQYETISSSDDDEDEEDTNVLVNIDIYGGNVAENVYGGANQNHIYGSTEINMIDGTVTGTIFGGSNTSGIVYNNTWINIYGGTISASGSEDDNVGEAIFAGGYGTNTYVYGTGRVKIYDTENDISISGSIYGGSSQGEVDGSAKVTVKDQYNSSIDISIAGNIYGGGKGTTNNGAKNESTSTVIVDGGTYSQVKVFGGANVNGYSSGNVNVYIGEEVATYVQEVYGGGNVSQLQSTGSTEYTDYVYIYENATVYNAFNGGNEAGLNDNFTRAIYAIGSNVTNLYGGSNSSGTLDESNVYVQDGATVANVYGGGLGEDTEIDGDTNVTITDSTITKYAYGGGSEGTVTGNTNVTAESSTIENLYGGGYGSTASVSKMSNVSLTDTIVNQNTYGGGKKGAMGTSNGSSTYIVFDNSTSQNVFGGGEGTTASEAKATANTEIYLGNSSIIYGNVYGGGDLAVVGGDTDVTIDASTVYGNVYAGGNGSDEESGAGTVSGSTSVVVTNSSVVEGSVFGAGKGITAEVAIDTNVDINSSSNIYTDVYGGGEYGTVAGNTNVRITSSYVAGSAYAAGKGELGESGEYNGEYALVSGSATIIAEGTTVIGGNLFGGGDASNIGGTGTTSSTDMTNNGANAYVYISGATIGKNVYGGSNRSKVFGSSYIYIGTAACDAGYEQGIINITGTVFGGGESVNDSGTFDYSFLSINGSIYIDVNGDGYDTSDDNTINVSGSIFGSGNASSAATNGNITIKNYGTRSEPKSGVSIQRATYVVIDNSSLKLAGTTDSTNEYASTNYTFNNITYLYLENNSTLYLRYGANKLASYYSYVEGEDEKVYDSGETKTTAAVTISGSGSGSASAITERNVDNRLYMYSGQNLNISNSENVLSDYGWVEGMTFFGIYEEDSNGDIYTGMYDEDYNVGDTPTWDERNFNRSYVLGLHQTNHDITVNGFYTVYEMLTDDAYTAQSEGTLTSDNYEAEYSYIAYIKPTPEEEDYYMWFAGPDKETYNYSFVLLASKYATLGAKELNLVGLSYPNATLTLESFSLSNWGENEEKDKYVELIDKNYINNVETDQTIANTKLGLAMKTGNSGWSSNSSTDFYVSKDKVYDSTNDYVVDEDYSGDNVYTFENSETTPTLSFYLYHSNNIQIDEDINENGDLGNYKINMSLLALNGTDRIVGDVIIDISIKVIDASDQGYNGSITPGKQYELFTATDTNITHESSYSVYFELAESNFLINDDEDNTPTDIAPYYYDSYRIINTEYVFPVNTTITMIDRSVNGSPTYYYYIVSEDDVEDEKTVYKLSEFLAMGSTDEYYNDEMMNETYYYETLDYQYESFIFIVDFENAEYEDGVLSSSKPKITDDPKMTIELRAYNDSAEATVTLEELISYQLNNGATAYNVYYGESEIGVDASPDDLTLYVGNTNKFTVDTSFTATTVQLDTTTVKVYDTHYFDKKLGVKLVLKKAEYDESGNLVGDTVSGSSLLGTYFEVNGTKYYPRTDGSTRIKISDLVSNVSSTITINGESSLLASGNYVIIIESYGSPDGIYSGIETSDQTTINLTVVNEQYGLKSTIPDTQTIVDKSTGYTLDDEGYISDGENALDVALEYSSSLGNPYITVSLERRSYDSVYSREYDATGIDLADYVTLSDGTELGGTESNETDSNETESDGTKLTKIETGSTTTRTEYEAFDTDTLTAASNSVSTVANLSLNYLYKSNLKSGTYRLVFTLYDVNSEEYQYIGEVYSYIVIK